MNEYRLQEIDTPTSKRKSGESYTDFAERRLAEIGLPERGPISNKAEVKKLSTQTPPRGEYPEDVIPDVDSNRSQAQIEIDAIIDPIDVLDAYDRWIGKNREQRNGRDHNIMVSCPMPHHPDATPSASVSFRKSDDGVWACHKCQIGGDKYDLAAIHYFGSMDGYKNKDDFPELRRLIAEEFGYTVYRSGKSEWLEPSSVAVAATPEEAGSPDPGVSGVTATDEASKEESPASSTSEEQEIVHPTLDWRTIPGLRQGTFLHEWLSATSNGDEPEEFYLGLGLMALGSAVGNQVKLTDAPMVRPNFLMSLVGVSGTGKSIAVGYMNELMRESFPWSMQNSSGIRLVSGVGSGEDLVSHFDVRESDPNGGPPEIKPVNGILDEDEMATLAARMRRPSATMRQYVMRLFDTALPVATSSRTAGRAEAVNHFFQLITTTQPDVLKDIMSNNDAASGYLNRWLYIFGNIKRRRAIRPAGLVDLTDSIELIKKVRAWSGAVGGRVVTWNDATAKANFEDYFHKRIASLQSIEGAWLVQRLDLMAKKICLVFAINDQSTTVLNDHVESMKVVMEWIIDAYAFVESKIGAADKSGEAEELIVEMMALEPTRTWTVRDMKRNNRKLASIHREASWAIDAAIKRMVAGSEIFEIKSNKTTRYSWNDQEDEPMASVTPISLKMPQSER